MVSPITDSKPIRGEETSRWPSNKTRAYSERRVSRLTKLAPFGQGTSGGQVRGVPMARGWMRYSPCLVIGREKCSSRGM